MNKTQARWHLNWDYKGAEKIIAVVSPYAQTDWNQTLVTRINQISAQIHQASLVNGADTIKLNSRMFDILDTFAYYDGALGVLSGRYKVIIDNDITEDEIYVLNKKQYDKDFEITGKPTVEISLTEEQAKWVEIEPHMADIFKGLLTFKSQDDIDLYKGRLVGVIKIENYPNPD